MFLIKHLGNDVYQDSLRYELVKSKINTNPGDIKRAYYYYGYYQQGVNHEKSNYH